MSHKGEALWYNTEQAKTINGLFRDGAAVVRSRVLLQDLNAVNNLPLGGKKTADALVGYFQRVKEGFILSSREGDVHHQKILRQFYEKGNASLDKSSDAVGALGVMNPSGKLDTKSAGESLTAYYLAAYAIFDLANRRSVAYADFQHAADTLELGEMEFAVSHWTRSPPPEGMWEILSELHASTHTILYQGGVVENHAMLAAGHFFIAGYNLSERMM
jgi:hypothetical protein